MAATIYDVAKKAGVSPATVSRVMNGYPYITEGKKKKVQEAMAELSYRPNPMARRMARLAVATREESLTPAL